MKFCPQCHTKYTDDTLQYCLQDGATLSTETEDVSTYETVSLDEPETVISKDNRDRITFDLTEPEEPSYKEPEAVTGSRSDRTSEKRSPGTLIVVFLTASVMLLIFAIAGIAAFLYFTGAQDGTAETGRSDISGSDPANRTDNRESENREGPPKASPTLTASPKPKESPADSAEIAKTIGKEIASWKSLAEARNLSSYMKKYASKLDYYNKRGASRSFVEADKRKAFSTYTSIKSKFTNIRITPSKDGSRATAVFDKEWNFSNSNKSTTGKVRSQLVFRNYGGKWLIVSERDLKVYYVNK